MKQRSCHVWRWLVCVEGGWNFCIALARSGNRLSLFESQWRKLFQLPGMLVLLATRRWLPAPRFCRVCAFRLSSLYTSQTTSKRPTILNRARTSVGNSRWMLWQEPSTSLDQVCAQAPSTILTSTFGADSGWDTNDYKHSIKLDLCVWCMMQFVVNDGGQAWFSCMKKSSILLF